MSKLSIFTFALGAAVGSVVTWRVLKTKYERIAQEEIRDMSEYYKDKYAKKIETESETNAEYQEYQSLAGEYGSDESAVDTEATKKAFEDGPYLIGIDEFGELYDYDRVSLLYYKDDVLTDTTNEPVDDEEELVGTDYKNHFGEIDGAPDAVYVRNDAKKIDYEIINEDVRWADVVGFIEEDE